MNFHPGKLIRPGSAELSHATEHLSCSVCWCILSNPVQAPCQHIFCRDCIEHEQCVNCPNCKRPLPGDGKDKGTALAECNQPVHRMLLKIKVCCPYHKAVQENMTADADTAAASSSQAPPRKKRRKNAGAEVEAPQPSEDDATAQYCEWEGEYGDLLSKHLPHDCALHSALCVRGCGKFVKKGRRDHHAKKCKKNFDICDICGMLVRPWKMESHRAAAAVPHVGILEKRLADAKEWSRRSGPATAKWAVDLQAAAAEGAYPMLTSGPSSFLGGVPVEYCIDFQPFGGRLHDSLPLEHLHMW